MERILWKGCYFYTEPLILLNWCCLNTTQNTGKKCQSQDCKTCNTGQIKGPSVSAFCTARWCLKESVSFFLFQITLQLLCFGETMNHHSYRADFMLPPPLIISFPWRNVLFGFPWIEPIHYFWSTLLNLPVSYLVLLHWSWRSITRSAYIWDARLVRQHHNLVFLVCSLFFSKGNNCNVQFVFSCHRAWCCLFK